MRREHENLNDTIASIDSPFWNEFYPPNGWRCRCYVVQTAEPETPEDKMPVVSPEDVKPEFRLNVGKSGQVFKEGTENGGKQHSYFALKKLLQNESENYRIAFELTKHNAPYHKIKGTNVRESLFADMRTPSRTDNLNEAKLISKNLKLAVDILPLINLKKHSSPEFRINGIIGDGVKRQGAITNTVNNAFKHKLGKRGQLSGLEKTFIAVNYGEVANLSNREFKRIVNSIYGRMTNNKQVEFLIISFNQKSVMIHAKDIPADSKEGHAYISKILSTLKNPKRSE